MRSLEANRSEMRKLPAPRRDYVKLQVKAFEWWLNTRHGHDAFNPPGDEVAPRDRILMLWAGTQSAEVQERARKAIEAQKQRMGLA